jgi:hypothetical protein
MIQFMIQKDWVWGVIGGVLSLIGLVSAFVATKKREPTSERGEQAVNPGKKFVI